MDALDLARWQFGITTVYHFLFVPLTIGLSFLVAGLHTAWVRTGKEHYLRATKFWGKLFLINFAMGVVTGIVQEFQFGMNWSEYSRFVGDIFGAPAGHRGAAGVLPGVDVPRPVDLRLGPAAQAGPPGHASGWPRSGTLLSAYFILAANSWMQHPVGYEVNEVTGRAELNDFLAVLTNPTTLVTFPHVIFAAFMAARRLPRRHLRLAPGAPPARRGHAPVDAARGVHPARRRRPRGDLGRLPGPGDDRAAADEDGRGRGGLGDRQQRRLLAVHHRLAGRLRGDLVDPGPRRVLLPGHQRLPGRDRGDQRPAGPVGRAVRRGRLHPERAGHLLVVPADDGLRRPRGALRAVDAVGLPQGQHPQLGAHAEVDRPPRHRGDLLPAAGQLLRLDLHRDGPPALDRLRPAAGRQRRLAWPSRLPRCGSR